jgi:hypothetical protein
MNTMGLQKENYNLQLILAIITFHDQGTGRTRRYKTPFPGAVVQEFAKEMPRYWPHTMGCPEDWKLYREGFELIHKKVGLVKSKKTKKQKKELTIEKKSIKFYKFFH